MVRETIGAGIIALLAGSACGQVVINEIIQDPPGDDEFWEFIELYGQPGLDLTGYAIALFKGGADSNDDGIPNAAAEIDEAFSLDGLSLGPSGFLVLYNDTGGPMGMNGVTDVQFFIPAGVPTAVFSQAHVPSPIDVAGKLSNGNSSTYLLMRRRPDHSVVDGESVYGPGYSVWKDPNPDVDFDGKLDFGGEVPIVGSQFGLRMDPMQIVDGMAWSNSGGKEYVRSSEQEISDTPGFDPDAVSRLNYFGTNPLLGNRVNGDNEVVETRMADESWVYGEISFLPASFDDLPQYDAIEVKGPTDPMGPTYSCPPAPVGEAGCTPDAGGSFLFDDIDLFDEATSTGFEITPGSFNDSIGVSQFRFVQADFDFDGDADTDDLMLIQSRVGATLDDQTDCVDPDSGMPIIDPSTNQPFACWQWEGRGFNSTLAMLSMDTTDGPGGGNAEAVTEADVAAVQAITGGGRLCADVNDDGNVTPADFTAWLALFNAAPGTPGRDFADVNQDGAVTPADFTSWLAAFNMGLAGPTCQ